VVRANLKRFVQGLTVSRPASWATEILRVDRIDANRVALDVGLKVKTEGRDQAGTAVFVLTRAGKHLGAGRCPSSTFQCEVIGFWFPVSGLWFGQPILATRNL
jgi:hypothetical protein